MLLPELENCCLQRPLETHSRFRVGRRNVPPRHPALAVARLSEVNSSSVRFAALVYAVIASARASAASNTPRSCSFWRTTDRFGSSFFSSASPERGSVRRTSRSPLTSLIRSIWILLRSTMSLLSAKTEGLQHVVELFRRDHAQLFVPGLSGSFEVALVEFCHGRRRMQAGDGRGLQNLVIQCDGQFLLIQVGANHQTKLISNNPCLRGRFTSERIHQRFTGKLDIGDDISTTQTDVSERCCVNHRWSLVRHLRGLPCRTSSRRCA